jgi:membrane associated rhomboid family serine protease
VLFGLAMGRYGTGTGLLAAYLAGAIGNVVSLFFSTRTFQGLGASGMVMGALGLLAAQTLHPAANRGKSTRHKLVGVGAGVLLFILFGLSPGTDTMAHFGGFVAGLILGIILVRLPTGFSQNTKVNIVSGILLMVLVAGTWWLALRK